MAFDPGAKPAAPRQSAPSVAGFDGLAADYDATFTCSAAGRALRAIVRERMESGFASCQTVLELGCGTGEDAIWLAGRGVHVLATDASPVMIDVSRRKGRAARCADRIEFGCIPMQAVGAALAGRFFDGVLSNFGAINCVQDLPALVAAVASIVRPGGKLLWVLMGRHVPWEWIWYASRAEWTKAVRRMRPGGVCWRGLTISYPAPAIMGRCLGPWFQVDRVTPLGLFLPPTYAAEWLEQSPRLLAALSRLEALARRSSALANFSDHYIVEATRR